MQQSPATFPLPPSAVIDFVGPHPGALPVRLAFGQPLEVLVARRPDEVAAVLNQAHAHARQGRWCVGHVAFEAAAAFDAAFALHATGEPLVWFAVHGQPLPEPQAHDAPGGSWRLGPWQSMLDQSVFSDRIGQIHRAIAEGEVYQINFTTLLRAGFEGDALALFQALRRAQPRSYAAYLDTGETKLLSVSPELFFDWRGGRILSRPMKGTAARGETEQEDRAIERALRQSAKEQAENLMIVDLIRNDVSRIAQPFSVQVPRLFDTEAWPTIWQMTSDVVAQTRPHVQLADVFAALFPCGSVTGAPKVRAMHWIKRLETQPRGTYCGAIGLLQPGGGATFNVAIRTIELKGGLASCGIGSGITADATAAHEWQEWQNKQAFLQRCLAPFELLETLRLENGQYPQIEAHLARMEQAAAHFGYRLDVAQAHEALQGLALRHGQGLWRARLCCDASGRLQTQAHALQETAGPVQVRLAARPLLQAHGEFVRFKTTRREHYDAFLPTEPEVFDTLLWNEEGELTEFTRGNVAVLLNGHWLTPAAHCGLLQGTGRALALNEGRVAEARILRDELKQAQGLAFINGLRGWLEARLVD